MDKVKIKKIDGLQWSLDIMNGQKSFPTFNKEPEKENGFDLIFKKACKNMVKKEELR